jgi:hypothetical protein
MLKNATHAIGSAYHAPSRAYIRLRNASRRLESCAALEAVTVSLALSSGTNIPRGLSPATT